MDFKGQHKAQKIGEIVIILGFISAFLYGLVNQDLLVTMIGSGIATFAALLFVIPNYSCYNRNQPNWLKVPVEDEFKEHTE